MITRLPALAAALLLAGCSHAGPHSALDPAGPQAAHIAGLWRLLLGVCGGVYGLVMLALLFALLRRPAAPEKQDLPAGARRLATRWISAATGLTALILAGLLGATLLAERRLGRIEAGEALTIRVTGRQWWWDITYEGAAADTLRTANEIHIPVGRPVRLRLLSADVIHSFWVPSLGGKLDLVPGRENQLRLQADRAGVFEGQCAEFCGYQHARMRILVIAEPEEEFQRWLAAQRRPARAPETDQQRRGQEVFLAGTCLMCHTVRGTPASSRAGPDLTHLASRRTLGAGALPNTRGHLAGWVLDSQAIKPGNHMPPHALPPAELHALLAYLEHLQ